MITAKYTKLFKAYLLEINASTNHTYGEQFSSLLNAKLGNEFGAQCYEVIKSMYNFYEIGSDDNDEMAMFLEDTIYLKYRYYKELYDNYTKEYNYATGNKKTVARTDHYEREGNYSKSGTNGGDHTEYELPNKVIPANQYKNTPSSIGSDDFTNTDEGENSSTTDGTSTIVTTYDNEFLDLKRKYLAQIRNLAEEFANTFKECFYIIYDSLFDCRRENT